MLRYTKSVNWFVLWLALLGLYGCKAIADPEWPKTDFSRTTVKLSEIMSGGPPKDGIPAIDKPKFVKASEADQWLNNHEPVIVVTNNSHARAYPLQILIYHEIVNDTFQDRSIAVTFCPLCNASLVFNRQLGDKILDFGTTGRLRKSDLVMYDRQTESWWQQFTGTGIVGYYAGVELEQITSAIVSYAEFKNRFPNGDILSRDTGYDRPYGKNPYQGYDSIDDRPFLYFDKLDPRLPPMERVIGISVNQKSKIYPFSILEKHSVINDKFEGHPVTVFSIPGMLSVLDQADIKQSRLTHSAKIYAATLENQILTFEFNSGKILDIQTQSEWNIFGEAIRGVLKGKKLKSLDDGVHFAFAWLAFRPDAIIYPN